MRMIRRSCDEVVTDVHVPPSEPIFSRAQIRRCDPVSNNDCLFQTNKVEVVLQHIERNMRSISDKTKPKLSTQAKSSLSNVVMARHRLWAAIANMSEHRQSVINRSA